MAKTSAFTKPNSGIHGAANHPTQNKTVMGNLEMGDASYFPHYAPDGAGGSGTGPEMTPGSSAEAANAEAVDPLKKKGRPKGNGKFTSLAQLRAYATKMGAA